MTLVTTRPPARRWLTRRTGTISAAALTAVALLTSAGVAGAAPQPTVAQVQKKLAKLMAQNDQAVQQYDQTVQELASARQRLALVNRGVTRTQSQFKAMHMQIAQLAAAAYENGTLTSAGALLTSSSPQTVISQASMLQHLSTNQATEVRRLVAAARALTTARQGAARTAAAVAALRKQQLARKKAMAAAVAQQRSLLDSLTAQQAAAVTGTGSTTASYSGSTATQAGKAVAFAYAQLGKPYVYGGAGPNGYDCSGLVQAAWAAAGVSIPRTTYAQWSGLAHVPMSALQPGDLVFFNGEGHVAIYVGGNMIIDAPTTGQSVEKISLSSSWYSSTVDGAARP